ncbi:MAG: long-chain acyl-CoA synthetase [Planctomycetota bacterium]|jgi:long-chain acyl-CoA synthetase
MQTRAWHQHYDESVEAAMEFDERLLPDALAESAAQFGDQTAVVFQNARLSYAELNRDVLRLATALSTLGVKQGDRVAIQLPNLPQTVIAFYAVLKLGAQAVMTNPLYTQREFEHQWKDAECRVAIVADYLYASKIEAHRAELPIEKYVIATIAEYLSFPLNFLAPFKLRRKGLSARVAKAPGLYFFKALLKAHDPSPPAVSIGWNDAAILQYTGGTTGVSKGAVLTHRNLSCNVQQVNAWFTCFEPGKEVMLTALPLFHVFGLTIAMNWPISTGSKLVLLPDPRNVEALVGAIEKERVTVVPAVPAMFNAINHFEGIEKRDLSSVKACFSGSAPLAMDVLEQFEALTGARILEGFGLTETSPVTHVNPLGGVRKAGSIGMPISSTDVKIVDESGATVPLGTAGELLISGPQVMQGYWNRPNETAEAFDGDWFRTGDLATVDEDGYFRIVGRKKDMIIAGGYNVYPDEIDDVLMSHPDILEATTIGIPHPTRGETVKSFIVIRPGGSLEVEAVDVWCRERLAAYKVPRKVEFLDELPKSTVMKVLRRELREREIRKQSEE